MGDYAAAHSPNTSSTTPRSPRSRKATRTTWCKARYSSGPPSLSGRCPRRGTPPLPRQARLSQRKWTPTCQENSSGSTPQRPQPKRSSVKTCWPSALTWLWATRSQLPRPLALHLQRVRRHSPVSCPTVPTRTTRQSPLRRMSHAAKSTLKTPSRPAAQADQSDLHWEPEPDGRSSGRSALQPDETGARPLVSSLSEVPDYQAVEASCWSECSSEQKGQSLDSARLPHSRQRPAAPGRLARPLIHYASRTAGLMRMYSYVRNKPMVSRPKVPTRVVRPAIPAPTVTAADNPEISAQRFKAFPNGLGQ